MSRGRRAPTAWRTGTYLALYLIVAVAPLALGAMEVPQRGQGFLMSLSIAMGFAALSVLGLQFALAARSPRLTVPFGVDVVLRYHRQLTLLAVLTSFGHPVILFLVDPKYRPLLDVVHAPLRAQLAWGSVAALVLLIITTLWRAALRLSYPAWNVAHTVLGISTVLAALGHAFLVDHYMAWMPMRALWAGYGVAFVALALWVRFVKPMRMWQRPWRVAELWPEPGQSLTVGLEPMYRHGGQRFRFHAGQFAWIRTGRRPWAPTYHPFSMSSSAMKDRVEFTIRDSGDFTSEVRRLKLGDTVYVDGPHGTFTLERHPAPGYVFLATGVGVTPFLSMLSTMADLGDTRPCWLFLGNRSETQIVGIRQLSRVEGRLNLTTVHVISQPGDQWPGEKGRIDVRNLCRHLPENFRDLHYYVCARDDVVHSMVRMLRRGLEIPADHVHAEQFQMV